MPEDSLKATSVCQAFELGSPRSPKAAAAVLVQLSEHGGWTADAIQHALGAKFWAKALTGLLDMAPRPADPALVRKVEDYAWLLGRADELHQALLERKSGPQSAEDSERIKHLDIEVEAAYDRALSYLEEIERESPWGLSDYMDRLTDLEVVHSFEVSPTGVPRPYCMLKADSILPEVVPALILKCKQQMAASWNAP